MVVWERKKGDTVFRANSKLSKEGLNSNSQQYHQYLQNEQSPLTSNHSKWNKKATYYVGNPGADLWQEEKCSDAYAVDGIPSLPFWYFELQRQYR
jgi:hypothetical protein